MMRYGLILVAILAMIYFNSEASAQQDEPKFAGSILVASDPSVAKERWISSSMTTFSDLYPDSPVYLLFAFANCHADEDGNCYVTASVKSERPDGKEDWRIDELVITAGQKLYPARSTSFFWQFREQDIMLEYERGDISGSYPIEATFTDHNSGKSYHFKDAINVVAANRY